jgi:hypothetical protein
LRASLIVEEVEQTGIHVMRSVEKGEEAETSALEIMAEYLRVVMAQRLARRALKRKQYKAY